MAYFYKEEIDEILKVLKLYGFVKIFDEKNSEKIKYSKGKIEIYFDRGNAFMFFPNLERQDFSKEDLKPLIFLTDYENNLSFIKKHLITPKLKKLDLSNFLERLELLEKTGYCKTRKKAEQIISDYNSFLKNWKG